jgi:hypothetical protein
MKKNKSIPLSFILLSVLCLILSSCQKKFDPSSYAPDKPFGGYNSSSEIAPSHLVAYWSFENTLNDSVQNLTGANTGTTFVNGKNGQALQGDSSSYVLYSNPGSIVNLKSYTIAFWMNAPQNLHYAYGIFSLNNSQDFWGSLDIYLDNPGSTTGDSALFKVHMNNGNAKKTSKFLGVNIPNPWNKWTHLVVTYDSSSKATTNFNIYANGSSIYSTQILDTTNNYGPLQFVNANAMVIGTWQFQTNPSLTTSATGQSWAGGFAGALDNFRIYDKALSASDISSLFKLETAGR